MISAALAEAIAPLTIAAPTAVLDVTALRNNAAALHERSAGLPLRAASKSVRCRWVLGHDALGMSGIMSFSLAESIWLARSGHQDILLAYPTTDRSALADLVGDPLLRQRITVMVDHPDHLSLIRSAGAGPDRTVQVCLDIDASLRLGPLHLGVRRSPLHRPEQAARAAKRIAATPGLHLRGVMLYDAQVAGLPDSSPAVRLMKSASVSELRSRRAAIVAAVREVCDIDLVNVGGTGSIHHYATDSTVSEATAGSGLYGPTLFDGYRDFQPRPALFLLSPVVRRPTRGVATVFSAGFVASGPASRSRLPRPVHPPGLALGSNEGAGEVQTPVYGRGTDGLGVGDLVWFRPAKAGEQLERVAKVHLVDNGELLDTVPTYRGEGKTWG